jgi:hypothetical protein
MSIRGFDKDWLCDTDFPEAAIKRHVESAMRALDAYRHRRMSFSDAVVIECALWMFAEGRDDFDRREQAELDEIEDRLGFVPVWLNLDRVLVRERNRRRTGLREDGEVVRLRLDCDLEIPVERR